MFRSTMYSYVERDFFIYRDTVAILDYQGMFL